MDARLESLAVAGEHIGNPYAVDAIDGLVKLLSEQQQTIARLEADATAMESIVGRLEAERLSRVHSQRRCPGCRSMVPAEMVEHLGLCIACDEADELLEARV